MRILLATRNPGKLAEIQAILHDLPVILQIPADLPEIEETGATFAENAVLKARAVAARHGDWALSDDSGLEVDALHGAPGILSARYGGLANDEARNQLLLDRLRGTPPRARTARFRAAVALCNRSGFTVVREGRCGGIILDAPRGSGGFGYDPLFLLPERGMTMAELPPELKNKVSHRARALAALRPDLARLLENEMGEQQQR